MYLIRGQSNIELFKKKHPDDSFIATIGNFDGLHLGHKEILKNMLSIAKEKAKENGYFYRAPCERIFC